MNTTSDIVMVIHQVSRQSLESFQDSQNRHANLIEGNLQKSFFRVRLLPQFNIFIVNNKPQKKMTLMLLISVMKDYFDDLAFECTHS